MPVTATGRLDDRRHTNRTLPVPCRFHSDRSRNGPNRRAGHPLPGKPALSGGTCRHRQTTVRRSAGQNSV